MLTSQTDIVPEKSKDRFGFDLRSDELADLEKIAKTMREAMESAMNAAIKTVEQKEDDR